MTAQNISPIRFGSVSMVTATLGANDPQIGDKCSVGGVDYQFWYNAGNSQLQPTYCATVSATAGYSCTVSTVTGMDFAVGVCRHATLTTGTYGWLAKNGFVPVQMSANNSAAVGDLVAHGTDGAFARHQVSGVTDGVLNPFYGKFVSAVASGGSGYAYVFFP